jgi:hypothetical protein
LGVLL